VTSRPLAAPHPNSDPAHRVIVVIPTYNERENLPGIVRQVLDLGDAFRVLVVDDNSPDGTGQVADDLAASSGGRVDVLHRQNKEGLGRAYIAGFKRAMASGAPIIAQMDADLSHRPEDLGKMVDAMVANVDLVLGSRYIPGGATVGWPWHRRMISRAGGIYAGRVLGVPIRDLTGGFKVWRREMLATIDLPSIASDGYSFQIETTYRAVRRGARIVQVPIVFHDRVAGKSKLSRRVVMEAAIKVWWFRVRELQGRA
jgi:dolichol-phosphate mannosyltransferase